MIFWYEDLIMGKTRNHYPDWSCTQDVTQKTRPARRAKWLRPDAVTPQSVYSFHTPFYAKTDGKQWVFQANSPYGAWKTAGTILSLFLIACLLFGLIPFPNEGTEFFLSVSAILSMIVAYSIYKTRTGGEDRWVVFDRTTGNVCFWKKNHKNSLTVPFNQVRCYWTTKYMRGGYISSLYLMPEVILPNERNRLWKIHMGFPRHYEQAQFYWRVLTDFMDRRRSIPEVPGLIHQVRFAEKNGYSIEDFAKNEVQLTEKEFSEIDEEINNDIAALEHRLSQIMEPKNFKADKLISFYEHAPIYARKDILTSIMVRLKRWIKFVKSEDRMMEPGFSEYFSISEYECEMDKLADFFFKLDEERRTCSY